MLYFFEFQKSNLSMHLSTAWCSSMRTLRRLGTATTTGKLTTKSFYKTCHSSRLTLTLTLEVCVPKLVLNETRLELISRISGTGTRLMFSGLVTQENLGKIREINMTRRDYSIPYRKFPNSTEFQDSSQKTSIIDLNYHI